MMYLGLRKLGKHLLWTQNVSEQNQKHFLCPGHRICVRNKCGACGQTEKHLCRQQCVRNNVPSFANLHLKFTEVFRLITKDHPGSGIEINSHAMTCLRMSN